MEINEIKKLENLKQLIARYSDTLKGSGKTEIKLLNYYELGCIITEMLKLCILAVDQDAHQISETRKTPPINVSLILETVLEMFPIDELELLGEITEMLQSDS